MSADIWWLETIFLLFHHAKQTRELTAPSNPRQLWDPVSVSVTSLTTQNGRPAKTETAFLSQHMGEAPDWDGRRCRAEVAELQLF